MEPEDKEQLCQRVVHALDALGTFRSHEWAAQGATDHQAVVGALKSLHGKEVVSMEAYDVQEITLSPEGLEYTTLGSPEARLWALLSRPTPSLEVEKALADAFKIAMMNGMKAGWIKTSKNPDKSTTLERKTEKIEDTVQQQLKSVAAGSADKLAKADFENLKRRTLVQTSYGHAIIAPFMATLMHYVA